MAIDNKTLYFVYPLRESSYKEKLIALSYEILRSSQIIVGYAKLIKQDLLKKNYRNETITAIVSDLDFIMMEVDSCVVTTQDFRSLDLSEKDAEDLFRSKIPDLISKIKDLADRARIVVTSVQPYLPETKDRVSIFAHAVDPIETVAEILTNPEIKLPNHLLEWLQVKDKLIKASIAGDSTHIDLLIAALFNPESFIRIEAIHLLCNIKDHRSVEPLIQVLSDDHWEIRVTTVDALTIFGDERAIKPLFRLLMEELANPTNINGAGRMIDALCSALKAVSGSSLREIQEQCINLLLANIQKPEIAIQNGAAWGFRTFPDARAIPLLISALRATPKPSFMAGFSTALETIGGTEAEEALRLYGR